MTKHQESLGLFENIEDIFLVTLFFTAGIGLAQRFNPPWTIYLAAFFLGTSGFISLKLNHPALTKTLIFLLFLCGGIIHASPSLQPPTDPHHIYNLIAQKQEASIIGILHTMPSSGDETTSFIIKTKEIIQPSESKPSSGLIRVTMPGVLPKGFIPGDLVLIRSTLSRIPPPSTPGEFDYRSFLAQQNVWIKGWIPSPVYLAKIKPDHDFSLSHNLQYLPEKTRHSIALFLDQTLPQEKAGLYRALLLGDKRGIPPPLVENFKSAGVMHLLAISGLHMALLAFCSIAFFTWLFKLNPRLLLAFQVKKIAALLSLIPLTIYALLAGFNPPVVRSLIMVSVFVLAQIWDRQWSLRNNIAIACFLILLVQPDQISSPSFQLSFAAVISISLFAPFFYWPETLQNTENKQSHLKKIFIWTRSALLVSLAAMAGTFPLLLYYFNRFSPISPIATLVIEPFLCFWSLLLGLTACLALPFSPWLAGWLLKIGEPGLLAVEHAVTWFASLSFATIWLPTPTAVEIILYYLSLVLVSQIKRTKLFTIAAVCCLSLLVGTILFSTAKEKTNPNTIISFLDVGQGSATVLELPNDHCILIDCGQQRHRRRTDIGQTLIAPFLRRNRIMALDQVVITHPHADHFNGLFSILKHFKPRILWINGTFSKNPEYHTLLALARRIGTEIRVPKIGEKLYEDKDIWLENIAGLHLTAENENSSNLSTNDKSLVLRLHHGQSRVLFPGDISWVAEKILLKEKYDLKADILLAAHHGADDSNSIEFLKAVAPEYIVISGKPQKMPKQINTHEYGSIFFISDGNQLTLKPR